LGSEVAACSENVLKQLGITHVLTVEHWEGLPDFEGITAKRIAIADRPSEPIHRYFHSCSKWIRNAIKDGGTVFVHCHAGISRSSTMVIAHLMIERSKQSLDILPFRTVLESVKAKRKCVHPNPGFLGQLMGLEQRLKRFERKKIRHALWFYLDSNRDQKPSCIVASYIQ
jgi:protein phosphatase slingshot